MMTREPGDLPLAICLFIQQIIFITFEAGCPRQMVSAHSIVVYRHAGLYGWRSSEQINGLDMCYP